MDGIPGWRASPLLPSSPGAWMEYDVQHGIAATRFLATCFGVGLRHRCRDADDTDRAPAQHRDRDGLVVTIRERRPCRSAMRLKSSSASARSSGTNPSSSSYVELNITRRARLHPARQAARRHLLPDHREPLRARQHRRHQQQELRVLDRGRPRPHDRERHPRPAHPPRAPRPDRRRLPPDEGSQGEERERR